VFGSEPVEEAVLDDRPAEALEAGGRELRGLRVVVRERVRERLDCDRRLPVLRRGRGSTPRSVAGGSVGRL